MGPGSNLFCFTPSAALHLLIKYDMEACIRHRSTRHDCTSMCMCVLRAEKSPCRLEPTLIMLDGLQKRSITSSRSLERSKPLTAPTFPESVTFTTLLTGRSLPVEIESVTDSQIRVLPYPRSLLLERTVPNQVPLRELGQGRTLCLTEAARELKDQGARGELPDSRCVHGSHS